MCNLYKMIENLYLNSWRSSGQIMEILWGFEGLFWSLAAFWSFCLGCCSRLAGLQTAASHRGDKKHTQEVLRGSTLTVLVLRFFGKGRLWQGEYQAPCSYLSSFFPFPNIVRVSWINGWSLHKWIIKTAAHAWIDIHTAQHQSFSVRCSRTNVFHLFPAACVSSLICMQRNRRLSYWFLSI